MKLYRTLLSSCAAAATVAAQAFVVTAHLPESMDGAMARLFDPIDGTRLDSALVADCSVSMRGHTAKPRALTLRVDESNFTTFVSDGDTVVFDFVEEQIPGGVRTVWDIRGSQLSDSLKAAGAKLREVLYSEDATYARYAAAMNEYYRGLDRLIAQNPDNTAGAMMFLTRYGRVQKPSEVLEMKAAAKKYPDLAKYEPVKQLLGSQVIGERFVDFSAEGLDGRRHSLADVAGRGRYVLIDFWGSWCGPCVRAIPELKKLREEYRDDVLYVLGVTVNDPVANTRAAVERFGVSWPCWVGTDAIARTYGISAVPTLVLISPDGDVLYKGSFDETAIRSLLPK